MTDKADKPVEWGDEPVTLRQWWIAFIIVLPCVSTIAAGWSGLLNSVFALLCFGLLYVVCAVVVWRAEPIREARIRASWKKDES